MGKLFEELKRRNVVRVGLAYAVVAWIIIEISVTVFPELGFPDWTKTFVIMIMAIGFPLALFFAWAFELTPEGVKKTKDVDLSGSVTAATGRKLDFVIIGALVLALGYFAYDKWGGGITGGGEAQAADMSIAVLPFVNMSDDAAQEYFSDGISEELLNLLAKIEGLNVAGRTSSFAYKGKTPNFKEVGDTLGVAHVLEGSVRKAGTRVRITAQLIRADNGYHLWSETYDRELTDIFAIQDEIAGAIVAELRSRLMGDEAVAIEAVPALPTATRTDIAAYDLYLLAESKIKTRNHKALTEAMSYLKAAIEKDPDFAMAHAALAETYHLLSDSSGAYGDVPLDEAYVLARPHVDEALRLDPRLSRAHAVLGLLESSQDRPEAAERALRRALAIDPTNAPALNWLNQALQGQGRMVEALVTLEKAAKIEPLWIVANSNLSRNFILQSRFDEAREILARLRRHHGDHPQILAAEGYLQSSSGHLAAAFQTAERSLALDPENRNNKDGLKDAYFALWQVPPPELTSPRNAHYVLLVQGNIPAALAKAREMFGLYPNDLSDLADLAFFESLAGNHDRVIELLAPMASDAADGQSKIQQTGGAAITLALAYQATGQTEAMQPILTGQREAIRIFAEVGFDTGIFDLLTSIPMALEGDAEGAMELLERAVGSGFYDLAFARYIGRIDALRNDPRMAALLVRIETHINAERANLGWPPIPVDGS